MFNKKIIIIAFCVVLIFAGCSTPEQTVDSRQKSVDSEQKSEIEKLIQKLGDDDWQTREKAQEKLIKMGKSIEPVLKKYENDPDPEVKMRIKQILNVLTPILKFKLTQNKVDIKSLEHLKHSIEQLGVTIIDIKSSMYYIRICDEDKDSIPYHTILVTIRAKRTTNLSKQLDKIVSQCGFSLKEVTQENK